MVDFVNAESTTNGAFDGALSKIKAHTNATDLATLQEDFPDIFKNHLTAEEQKALLSKLDLPLAKTLTAAPDYHHRLWVDGGRYHSVDEWRAVQHYRLKTDLIRTGFITGCLAVLLFFGLIYLQAFGVIKGDSAFGRSLGHFIEILRTAIGG